jgi:hypothetical protein
MSDIELNEKIVVDGAAEAATRLGKLAAAAQNVMHAFHGLSEVVAVLGGIAGVVKVAETIQDTDQLYKAVGRVATMTGLAAGNVHAMFDQFELGGGIGQEAAESIIMALTRLKSEVARGDATALQTMSVMSQLGVSVKNGPQEALIGMAAAAEKGKVGVDGLVRAFNIPRSQAAQMLGMLSKGPEKLKDIAADTLKGAQLIDDKAIDSYKQMTQARRELADAWGGIVGVLYKNLIPAVTEVLKSIKEGFDDIKPVADAIGRGLATHMHTIVSLAKTYLALMLAAKAANMATGQQLSVLGWGKSLLSRGGGLLTKAAAVETVIGPGGRALGMIGGGGIASAGANGILTILSSVAGKFGLIGIVVGALVGAFYLLKENVFGVTDAIKGSLGKVWDSLKAIWAQLVPVLKQLWDALKPVVAILGGIVVAALMVFVGVLQGAVTILELIVTTLTNVYADLKKIGMAGGAFTILKDIFDPTSDIDAFVRQGADDSKVTGKNAVMQDFRGSHFEITNNFPQGIDGGRVAVAFGDELAALGERRLESGLRPLYSYR